NPEKSPFPTASILILLEESAESGVDETSCDGTGGRPPVPLAHELLSSRHFHLLLVDRFQLGQGLGRQQTKEHLLARIVDRVKLALNNGPRLPWCHQPNRIDLQQDSPQRFAAVIEFHLS